MNKILLITLILGIVLSSCKKEKLESEIVDMDGIITIDSNFAAELRSNPTSLIIGNNNLFLITGLWRDFMPSIGGIRSTRMTSVNQLTEVDSIPILSTIKLKKQYVINGNEIWTVDYSEIRHNFAFILEGIARNGPKWETKKRVDVVCEFENSGKTYRIIANSQLIDETH